MENKQQPEIKVARKKTEAVDVVSLEMASSTMESLPPFIAAVRWTAPHSIRASLARYGHINAR